MADISKISPDNGTTEYNIKDATARADIATINGKIGTNNGIATLDNTGHVPSSQLPSYVDDVIEGYYYEGDFYKDAQHTDLITPESGKIYVDLSTNKEYRWGGTVYVDITGASAWGEIGGTLSDQTDLQNALDDKISEYLLRDSTGRVGKNFIPFPYDFTEATNRGVTFKVEDNRTITLSGEATSGSTYASVVVASGLVLPKDTQYYLTIIATEETNGYFNDSDIRVKLRKTSADLPSYSTSVNIGTGSNSITPGSGSADTSTYEILLEVKGGTDLTDGVFNVYVALLWEEALLFSIEEVRAIANAVNSRLFSVENKVPTNASSSNKMTTASDLATVRSEQRVLGAKNLFPNNADTQTINGVTFTVNADGSVTANGTASADTRFSMGDFSYNGEDLILSGSIGGSNITYSINVAYLNSSGGYLDEQDERDGDLTLNPVANTALMRVRVYIRSGVTVKNKVFYPMLRLASDPDDTYVPYAMTNRELTEMQKGVDGEITFESAISQASVSYAKLVKFGRIVYCQLKLNAITVNAWTKMGTIPSGFRPLYELFLPMWIGSNIDHIRIQINGEIGSGNTSISNANVRFSGFWITS